MAKNTSGIGWIRLGLTTVGIVVIVVTAFVWAQADIKAVDTKADNIKEDLVVIKKEGCNPSGGNTLNVALMQKDISTIQTAQSTMQTDIKGMRKENREGLKAILDRLPK